MANTHIDLNLFRIFDRAMSLKALSVAAISQAIHRLSDLIGEPLFRREGREISPTHRAFGLHREIRSALNVMERSLLFHQEFAPLSNQRVFHIAQPSGPGPATPTKTTHPPGQCCSSLPGRICPLFI